MTFAAHADATILLGSSTGGLVFEPATLTIKSGETITWKNNAGYPHNIVFDEDDVPVSFTTCACDLVAGWIQDALSRPLYVTQTCTCKKSMDT